MTELPERSQNGPGRGSRGRQGGGGHRNLEFVNLSVTGDIDGELVVFVNGQEAARITAALDRRLSLPAKIEVRAKKSTKDLNASRNVDFRPGIQDVTLALT